MPKIIENLPEKLMEEARRQIEESGYGAMTVRSVAKGCGVGVGTVYNYFPSKDALVASFMLSDWKVLMAQIQHCADTAGSPDAVLLAMYQGLHRFLKQYEQVFRDEAAAATFSGSGGKYHSMLRSQLAAPLESFCPDSFTAQFLAEALLTWTVEGTSFDELQAVLRRLF